MIFLLLPFFAVGGALMPGWIQTSGVSEGGTRPAELEAPEIPPLKAKRPIADLQRGGSQPVPEPSTGLMILLGLVGLAGSRGGRRRG